MMFAMDLCALAFFLFLVLPTVLSWSSPLLSWSWSHPNLPGYAVFIKKSVDVLMSRENLDKTICTWSLHAFNPATSDSFRNCSAYSMKISEPWSLTHAANVVIFHPKKNESKQVLFLTLGAKKVVKRLKAVYLTQGSILGNYPTEIWSLFFGNLLGTLLSSSYK